MDDFQTPKPLCGFTYKNASKRPVTLQRNVLQFGNGDSDSKIEEEGRENLKSYPNNSKQKGVIVECLSFRIDGGFSKRRKTAMVGIKLNILIKQHLLKRVEET